MMQAKLPRKKKCKVCLKEFQPERQMQPCCSIKCAINKVQIDKAAKFNKETKLKKEAIKSKAQWLREAQKEFNAYIRLRDCDKPCVSCLRHHDGQYHAGHYRSVGACPELRFNELNVWKQCAPCNNHLSGNIGEYRINLVKLIGVDKVECLEGKHIPLKLSIDEIKAIKAKYKLKQKEAKQ
jgi:hypothetical protein